MGSMTEVVSDHYNAGFLAHGEVMNGNTIKNPHQKGTQDFQDWQAGFRHASEDYEKLHPTKKSKRATWDPCGNCQACRMNFPRMCTSPNPV